MSPSAEETASAQMALAARLLPALSLQEGELIVLVLKPSLFFSVILTLPMVTAAVIVSAMSYLLNRYSSGPDPAVVSSVMAALALARFTVACWQWMGRTYILTTRRIITVRGVVNNQMQMVSLSDVKGVDARAILPERLSATGSIYCMNDKSEVVMVWATVARPVEVLEVVQEYVRRAHHPPVDKK